MKRGLSVVVLVILGLAEMAIAGDLARATLAIKEMTCGGCVAAVRLQLKRTDGISR